MLNEKPSIDKAWLKWYSKEALEATVPYMKSCDYLFERNKDNLDLIALNYFGNKINYRDLIKNVNFIASSFQNIGVKEGDIVTFCMPTLPETIYSFYALNKIGAIAAFIDPTTNTERIQDFINLFNSKLLIAVDLFSPKLKEVVKNTSIENTIIVSATDSLSPVMNLGYNVKKFITDLKGETYKIKIPTDINWLDWKNFKKMGNGCVIEAQYEKNKSAAIVLTSGTTGIPKGAVLTNENLNAIALEQSFCTNMAKKDTFLNIMPPFIAYGLVCGVNNVLCNGLEMYIVPKFEKRTEKDYKQQLANETKDGKKIPKLDKSSMLDTLLIKKNPNHVLGVPNFYLNLKESEKLVDKKLDFLKCVIAGGDVLHVETEELINSFLEAHACELNISKGYGMTELSSVATFTNNKFTNKVGSVGIPVMFNNVKIVDLNTSLELGYNQTGELYMSGPGVISGYFGNDEETKRVFITDSNGTRWIKTGDLFSIDEDGVLYFKGRVKRMIIRSDGHNVFPCQIEDILLSHQDVKDCAVIGIKEKDKLGEIPTAFVSLKDSNKNISIIEEELRDLSLNNLPERDVALEYKFVDSIPYTTFGKVDYLNLKEKYETEAKKLIKR